MLPIFGWYGPKGTQAEGVGVIPDVTVDVEPDCLSRGIDTQLRKAAEVLQ